MHFLNKNIVNSLKLVLYTVVYPGILLYGSAYRPKQTTSKEIKNNNKKTLKKNAFRK